MLITAFLSLHTALCLLLNNLFSPIIMISFWRTTFNLSRDRDRDRDKPIRSTGLIGLIGSGSNSDSARGRSSNVVESTSAAANPSKDPGRIGFIDDIGGGVDGLMSCTESLGFESSDERRLDDDEVAVDPKPLRSSKLSEKRRRALGERKFPPPISSLNRNGQPSFFLRPLRKDGRLELTEVRINRPEILRATRGYGRLRLHLIRDDEIVNDENCIREESEEQEDDIDSNVEKERELVAGGGEEWRFPGSSSGEEGFRRCQQNLQPHYHAVWRHSHPVRRLHVAV